ncbi:DUF1266 domain-containing protein [Streptomyces sp. NHF165]|uniref:DUF1266 domain-containing protein n=1 Tax=Streptomyces sp. NHF165 TaxID=2175864 RepID=UPI001F283C6B|nr:DUF1266 domain-containing protein [Streptomyces sp. NHF165]
MTAPEAPGENDSAPSGSQDTGPGTPLAAPEGQPPSEVEERLMDAKSRMDWGAYLDVLADTDLFFALPRALADEGRTVFTPEWRPEIQAQCLVVYTTAMLPPPVEDPVFRYGSLGWLAEVWDRNDPPWLAVNPGSPCEAYFPASRAYCALWAEHAARAPAADTPRVLTLRTGGPHSGPVARGLACGALLCATNHSYWNAVHWHGTGYPAERRRLEEWWGVTTREKWREYVEELLRMEMSSPVWDFVLGARRSMARDFGGHVDTEQWKQTVERVMWRRATEVEITPEGVTVPEGPDEDELRSHVEGVKRLIGRIVRYEKRFRADGLLPVGRFVRSVAAWDLGRASKMARWGLGARFCSPQEMEDAVVRAGRVSMLEHTSWEDFSAGYILGRCLHFDEEEFGSWYADMLAAHEVLMSDPESPWRTIPFR